MTESETACSVYVKQFQFERLLIGHLNQKKGERKE